jgi:glycerophosphoryl diester phosphodiesterase
MTDASTGPDPAGRRHPRVVAHRGASDEVAEHTLFAFRQALADGADALECDVRMTRDGHLVCVHDRRLERTSDGRGVVSTKRLEQLTALDWATWKNPWADLDDEAELPDRSQLALLTLRDLLRMVRDHPAPVELFIETKHPTRYSGWVERRLVDLLEEFGWAKPGPDGAPAPVRVISYSQLSLRRMTRWAPAVPLAWVFGRDLPLRVRRGDLPRGVGGVAVSCALVRSNPQWVARMRARGHDVYVWVVNSEQDLLLCQDLGVDAVITDRPRLAREVFGAGPPAGPSAGPSAGRPPL